MLLAWMHWDPGSVCVTLPFLGIPITWYGLFFASGFLFGSYLLTFIIKQELLSIPRFRDGKEDLGKIAAAFTERLALYMIVATVLGARMGHVLFYEEPLRYIKQPWLILKTWEGGLASHGAVVFILIAFVLFYKRVVKRHYPEWSLLRLIDFGTIPAMLIGTMIRLGNFFNQEILGSESSLPWAVVFGHPADGSLPLPRHPAQLYEAIFYLTLFAALTYLWYRKRVRLEAGLLTGLTLFATFLFRFVIEFLKAGQSVWFDRPGSPLLMGQLLSIPFIFMGIYLLTQSLKKSLQLR